MGLFTLNLSTNCNLSPNSFRNWKNGFCEGIHTKLFAQFVDEFIGLWCEWAFSPRKRLEVISWFLSLPEHKRIVVFISSLQNSELEVDWQKIAWTLFWHGLCAMIGCRCSSVICLLLCGETFLHSRECKSRRVQPRCAFLWPSAADMPQMSINLEVLTTSHVSITCILESSRWKKCVHGSNTVREMRVFLYPCLQFAMVRQGKGKRGCDSSVMHEVSWYNACIKFSPCTLSSVPNVGLFPGGCYLSAKRFMCRVLMKWNLVSVQDRGYFIKM